MDPHSLHLYQKTGYLHLQPLKIVQFQKLGKLEVGGTKGKTLTTSVQQIYTDFEKAVATFRAVQYDIMDVDAKSFDDDFYEFRVRIKELERRLASVLSQGFDDCVTIIGKFKLLDSFEGLLNRPILADELEKKHDPAEGYRERPKRRSRRQNVPDQKAA